MSDAFSFLAITVLAFGVLLLLTKRGKDRSDYLLLLWFSIFGVHLITINGLEWLPPLWFKLNTACSFLHGPLFLGYVLSLSHKQSVNPPAYLHLGGALLVGAVVAAFNQPIPLVINALIVITYSFLSAKMLRKRTADIHGFSPTLLTWLRFLLLGLLIILIIPLVQVLVAPAGLASSHNLIGTMTYCAFIIALTFWGIRMAPILVAGAPAPVISPPPVEASKPRYEQSGLAPSQREAIFLNLDKASLSLS
ncbi:MAG: hypothetical protein AB8H12_23645 [Lewinella sp.]